MINSVLLIRPSAIGKKEFPFGLLYVGTALKQKGYKVQIIDLHDAPDRKDAVFEILSNSPNAILGISALAPHYSWVKRFTLKVKKISPKTIIIIGGHIAILNEMLLNNTGVDYVCLGEGEEALSELIEKINNKEPIKKVLGIAYKDNNTVINTGFRPLLKSFLLPDYELINVHRYLIHPKKDFFFRKSSEYQARSRPDDKLSAIIFSRGCVGGCNFCYRHLPGFRQASIEWSWEHLMILYKKYNVRYFRIDDELFTNNIEWFQAFYQKVLDSNINILFRITGIRVDLINDKQLKMLKEMGCIAINYGLESGSQKILDNMNKRTTVEQNIGAIKKTIAHGMQTMAYIIFGYVGETKETLQETMAMILAVDLDPEYVSIFYTVPLPGTVLYKYCLKNKLIKNEELYMETISDSIANQHERYTMQLGEIKTNEIFIFEKKLLFLLYLKRLISKDSLIFKIIKKIVLLIPYKSKTNNIFVLGIRILIKITNKK